MIDTTKKRGDRQHHTQGDALFCTLSQISVQKAVTLHRDYASQTPMYGIVMHNGVSDIIIKITYYK